MDDEDESDDAPPPSVGDQPLASVVAHGTDVGSGQFGARPGAAIVCFTCHEEFPAAGVAADDIRRLEGESDPADMSLTVPVSCPHCGTAGLLTLQYGPEASRDEVEAMAALPRDPSSGVADVGVD